ncbi:unnamed protein product [Closterium sp. NIES-54]
MQLLFSSKSHSSNFPSFARQLVGPKVTLALLFLHSGAPPATRAPMPLIVVTSASPSAKASPTASASPSPSSSAASCSSIPLSSFAGSTTTHVAPAEVLLQNLLP